MAQSPADTLSAAIVLRSLAIFTANSPRFIFAEQLHRFFICSALFSLNGLRFKPLSGELARHCDVQSVG
jgi:hypothetical protein